MGMTVEEYKASMQSASLNRGQGGGSGKSNAAANTPAKTSSGKQPARETTQQSGPNEQRQNKNNATPGEKLRASKQEAAEKANSYTAQINALENEKHAKSDIYVDGVYMGFDKYVAEAYDERINNLRQQQQTWQAKADKIDTDKQRDAALSRYQQAVANEQAYSGYATDAASAANLDQLRIARERAEDALKKENRRMGNYVYADLSDEARSRDAVEGYAGERLADYGDAIATGAEWLDHVTRSNPENGEYEPGALGQWGAAAFENTGKVREQAEADWADAQEGMSEGGKYAMNIGKTVANTTEDMLMNMMLPGAGRVAMGLRAGGSGARTQAGRENNDINARMTKMMLDGGVAYLSEWVGGGVEAAYGKSVLGNTINKWAAAKGLGPLAKRLLNTEGLEEGIEYGLGYIGDRLLGLVDHDPGWQGFWADWDKRELAENVAVGYLIGTIFNGSIGEEEYDAKRITAVADEAIEAARRVASGEMTVDEITQIARNTPSDNVKIGGQKTNTSTQTEAETGAAPAENPTPVPVVTSGTEAMQTSQNETIAKIQDRGTISKREASRIQRDPELRSAFEEAYGVTLDGKGEKAATQAVIDAVNKQTFHDEAVNQWGEIPDAKPGFEESPEGKSKGQIEYERGVERMQKAQQDVTELLAKESLSNKDIAKITGNDYMWQALQDVTGINLENKGRTILNVREAIRENKNSLRDVDTAETLSDVATGKPAAGDVNSQANAENANKAGLNRTGESAKPKQDTPRAKRGSGTVSYSGATVDGRDYAAVDRSKLTRAQKNQIEALEKFAEVTGVNITFYQSQAGENGKLKGANGIYKDGTIYLDVNAGLSRINADGTTTGEMAIVRTAGHELTHFIQQFNEGDYNNIRDYIVKTLSEKTGAKGLEELIERKQIIAKRNGHELSRDGAINEVIADGCEMMLKDSTTVETLAKENRSLAYKIRRWIKQWNQKIQEAFKGVSANSAEAKILMDNANKLQKMWDDALTKAAKAQGIDPKTELHTDGVVEPAIKTMAAATNTDTGSQYDIRAFEHDEDDYRKMLKAAGWDDKKITDLFNMLDSVDATINENLEALDYETGADIDDRVFSPVKKNSDKLYKVSLDYSTLCRKRVLQGIIVGELSAAMGRGVTKGEGIVVRDALMALQEEGKQIEVACALCYVESARMRSQAAINRFLDDREAAMQDFYAKKYAKKEIDKADEKIRKDIARRAKDGTLGEIGLDGIEVDEKGRIKGRGDDDTYYDITKKKSATLDDLPPKVKAKIQEATKAAREQYKMTAEQQAIVKEANSLPVTLFTTADGIETLKKRHPDVWGAYNQMVSAASKSKGIEDDTWWRAGDSKKISAKLIAEMNKENGLRTQSWSDFQVKHLMDYIAATIELSARGAKQHAYTKVLDYVDLMGETGVMINMSLIPTREFRGKLEYDNVEGINYEEAMKMRKKYPDTAGTICIGMNTEQIHQLLESTDIDYVIPYHISGMSAETRELMHIPLWENFQDWQNEKKVSGKAAEKNAKKYGATLLPTTDKNWHKAPNFSDWFDLDTARAAAKKYGKTGKYGKMTGGYKAMQDAAKNYARICAERGLLPKFSYGDADYSADPNYWKLLIDRKMVNNNTGDMIEQKPLQPKFKLKTIQRILNDEVKRYAGVKADQEEAVRRVTAAWKSGKLKEGMTSDEIAKVMHEQQDTLENASMAMAADQAQMSDRDSWDEGYRTNIENSEALAQEVREYLYDHGVDPEELEDFGVNHFPAEPLRNISDADNALNMISDLSMDMTGKKRTEAFELMEGLLQRMDPVDRERLAGEESKNPAFARWYNKKHPSLYYKGYKPGDLMLSGKPKKYNIDGTLVPESSKVTNSRLMKANQNLQKEVDHLHGLLESGRLTAEDEADARDFLDRLERKDYPEEVFYSDRDADEITEKNRAYNESKTETGSPLKTLNGSAITRGGSLGGIKYPVGKVIGGRIYFHKNYAGEIANANPDFKADFARAEKALRENYPDFQYNCLNYSPETGMIQFQEAPGFDTEREPVVGKQVNVSKDGAISGIKNFGQIWHHKWLWVDNDYKGFDVDQSWNWSKRWLSSIKGPSKGGSLDAWNKQLGEFNLPEDGSDASFSDREAADAPVPQGHTSKGTSIVYKDGKLPTLFGKYADKTHFKRGGTNLDMGGGKTDVMRDFMRSKYDVDSAIYDPFNRDKGHNTAVLDRIRNGERFDTATCSNVLNVIDNAKARANVVLEIAKGLKPDGEAYFTMWEAPEAGERGAKKDNWQEARSAESYIPEIEQYFEDVHIEGGKNGIVIAKKPRANLPQAAWQLNEEGDTIRHSERDPGPDEETPKVEQPKAAPKHYRLRDTAAILADASKPRAPRKVLSEGSGKEKVSRYYSNTMAKNGTANGVPPITYKVKSESESLANAAARLKADYRGMINYLVSAEAWSGEMGDAAALVEQELAKEARRTGNKKALEDWYKIQSAKRRESARGVQSTAKLSRPGAINMLRAVTSEIDAVRQANEEAKKSWKTKEIVPEETLKRAETKAQEIYDKMLDLEIEIDDKIDSGMDEQKARESTKERYLDLIDDINAFRHTGLIKDAGINKEYRAQIKENVTKFRRMLSAENMDYIQRFAACDAAGISEDIHYKGKQDFLKRLNTWQKLAQLTGTGTWGRNLIGNGSFGLVDALATNNPVTILADAILGGKTGKRSSGLEGGILNKKARAAARQFLNRSILEVAANIDLATDTDQTKYDMGRNRTYDPDGKAMERLLSRWEQWNGYMLESSDAWFKGLAEGSAEQAIRKANNWDENNLTKNERSTLSEDEAAKLTKARQKELNEVKQQIAKYRTFQNDGIAAEAANEIRDWLNKKGAKLIGKTWKPGQFGLGTALMPYTKVPTNLGVKSLEFSPLGAAKGLAEIIKVANDPKATMAQQNKAVTDFGRGMTGTMLIALLAALMKKAPWFKDWEAEEDPDIKAQNKAEGKSGMQVNWSLLRRQIAGDKNAEWQNGDHTVDVTAMEPVNQLLTTASLIADGESASRALFKSTKDNLMGLPSMQALQNIENSIKYTDTPDDGWATLLSTAASTLGSTAGGMIPAPLRHIGAATDPYARDTSGDNAMARAWNQTISSVPGLRKSLPVKTDAFGNPVYAGSGMTRVANQYLPFKHSQVNHTEVSREINRIYQETGSNYMPGRTGPKSVQYGSGKNAEKIKLTARERKAYKDALGQDYQAQVDRLIYSSYYKKADDETKAAMLAAMEAYSKDTAKVDFADAHDIEYAGNYANVRELRDPNKYLGIRAGYTTTMKNENYDAVDALLKSAKQMPTGDLEYMREHTDNFGVYYDLAQEGVRAKSTSRYQSALKERVKLEGKTSANGYDIFQTVVEQKFPRAEADAFMNRTKSDGSYYVGKGRHSVYEAVRAAGGSPAEALAIWDILDVNGNGQLTKKELNSALRYVDKSRREAVRKAVKAAMGWK